MKRISWQVYLGIILVVLSAVLYFGHYLIFHEAHHIFIYLLGDIAFVPLEVLLVTVIIHRLLSVHEKRALYNKLNIVIGTFFREMGTELLARLAKFDANSEKIRDDLVVSQDSTRESFLAISKHVMRHKADIQMLRDDLEFLRDFLAGKKDFLLQLMQNPNLLEHASFTNSLWAISHLTDELAFRDDISSLPETDLKHLAGDIDRAYGRLIRQWVAYMKHLKEDYPYLFSLAVRTNPFDSSASPIVG